jgi:D-3-phosphoglycerate dehydrogenase
MDIRKVLISDDVHPVLLEGLQSRGCEINYLPMISYDEVLVQVHKYDGLVINSKIKAHQQLLSRAPNLKFIARLGSGLEIIDLDLAKSRGIQVFSAPEGNCIAVAEHAMGMLLSLLNNLMTADQEVRRFTWKREQNRGREMSGLTVGIVGYGHTGPAFAAKLAGFDVKVLVHDAFKPKLTTNLPYVQFCDLQAIQRQSDIISLHVSLNETSHHMIDQEFIDACAKPFILINTARGKAVHLADLLAGLRSGKVLGACLDVFENEKPQTFDEAEKALYSQLYQLSQVVLTPHIAGWTFESKRRIAEVLLKKLDDSGILN